MDEIERLFVIRIRDPGARAIIRGRLADMGAVAVTPNTWELPKSPADDPEAVAGWWEDELKLLEDTIDLRTDVIYMWMCSGGIMIRSTIGGGA